MPKSASWWPWCCKQASDPPQYKLATYEIKTSPFPLRSATRVRAAIALSLTHTVASRPAQGDTYRCEGVARSQKSVALGGKSPSVVHRNRIGYVTRTHLSCRTARRYRDLIRGGIPLPSACLTRRHQRRTQTRVPAPTPSGSSRASSARRKTSAGVRYPSTRRGRLLSNSCTRLTAAGSSVLKSVDFGKY